MSQKIIIKIKTTRIKMAIIIISNTTKLTITMTKIKTMNFNNYTIKSQEAVQNAMQIAALNKNQSIEIAHLLKGIINVDENVTPFLFKKLNVNLGLISKIIDKTIESFPKSEGTEPYLSKTLNQALLNANNRPVNKQPNITRL
jgi:ATP-dependent Clp protease ATP-binding subunit ClpA